jgi:hypothetical protein
MKRRGRHGVRRRGDSQGEGSNSDEFEHWLSPLIRQKSLARPGILSNRRSVVTDPDQNAKPRERPAPAGRRVGIPQRSKPLN